MSTNTNDNSTTSPPSWFLPDYPPLKSDDDVGRAAIEGQIYKYPKVVRQQCDPVIVGQHYGNVSFMLFDTPRISDGKPVYGFMKVRGNHDSQEVAYKDACRIVREIDSKFQVRIAPVGVWVPITENDRAVKEVFDVRESDKEIHLRDEAIKEKEKQQAKIAQELKEAEEKLVKGGDIYDNPDSLDFYTMKRVTEMTLMETRKAQQEKIDMMEKKIAEQRIILKRLERDHPEYKSQWIPRYDEERKKTGISRFIPGETQFDEYEASNLDDLLAKYGDHKPEAIGKSSIVRNDEPERNPLLGRNANSDVEDIRETARAVISLKSTAKK